MDTAAFARSPGGRGAFLGRRRQRAAQSGSGSRRSPLFIFTKTGVQLPSQVRRHGSVEAVIAVSPQSQERRRRLAGARGCSQPTTGGFRSPSCPHHVLGAGGSSQLEGPSPAAYVALALGECQCSRDGARPLQHCSRGLRRVTDRAHSHGVSSTPAGAVDCLRAGRVGARSARAVGSLGHRRSGRRPYPGVDGS